MHPHFHTRLAIILLVASCVSPRLTNQVSAQSASPDVVWQALDNIVGAPAAQPQIRPLKFRTYALNTEALRSTLAKAPMEFTQEAQSGGRIEVTLPMPDGKMARFLAEESPIMEAPLAAKFPDIKTYRAQGVDDPAATARFSLTRAGLHAIILSPSGAYYIDPYSRGDAVHHLSYFKRDLERTDAHAFECQLFLPDGRDASTLTAETASDAPVRRANGGTMRTYRLALAANYEYSDFHSDAMPIPDKGDVMANGLVPTMNRVNGIYEREVAVRMVIVANNDLIIFNTPADPYENSQGLQMLAANQGVCDGAIGPTNYDIGHVVSTGGGGVAFLGVVCNVGQKAGGVTGLPQPIGDPFYVDYVAHEMGHQFAGAHTFNGNVSNCAGSNRTASTAYEPGSGSTIQAYAGICPPQDLQRNSDPYFHTISYDQILDHITTEATCSANTATGNVPPTIDAGPDYSIPARTPFTLTAVGNDPDGDFLSYCWEEFDLGPTNNGQEDNGRSPIFRSYNPTTSPSRTFPSLKYILGNANTPPLTYPCGPFLNRTCITGELLPTMSRPNASSTSAMKFRVTARDNRLAGGGVNYDLMQVSITDTGEPFVVSAPNGGETWDGSAPRTVTWNVAGTAAAPINAANVDIHLSIDGGHTFPIVLATAVPNDGSHEVAVPAVSTQRARVRVTGAGNIFFDITNADFVITSGDVPQVSGVVSRKTHGTSPAQDFAINLPFGSSPGVECRSGESNGNYTVVFTFANPLTSVGSASMGGTGSVASSGLGSDPRQYIVNLAGVTDLQTIAVALVNVSDSTGKTGSLSTSMKVLIGDTNGDSAVNAGDAQQTRNRSGQSASATTFRSDVNLDGNVNAGDATIVRTNSGRGL